MRLMMRLGSPDFTRLWVGNTVSVLGTAVTSVALPLVALSVLNASTFEVGVINAAQLVSWLLLGLSAGVWIDRTIRRPLMITCDLVRAAALVSIPLAWIMGVLSIAQLVLVALVIGVLTVFFDIAAQTYLPSIVPRDELLAANTRLQTSEAAARTGGPALGGALVSLIGASLALTVDVVSYLFSAICLWRVRQREARLPAGPGKQRMLPQIREGLSFVLGDRVLRPLTLVAASLNFLSTATDTLAVPFLLRTIGLRPSTIGLLIAAGGVGAVAGAIVGGPFAARVGTGRALLIAALAIPPLALLVPFSFGGAGLALFVAGLIGRDVFTAMFSLLARSYRQYSAPTNMLTRVTASIKFLSWGVLPFGALAGGALGEALGNRGGLIVIGVALLLTPLPIVCSPLRHRRDLEEDVSQRPPAPQASGVASVTE